MKLSSLSLLSLVVLAAAAPKPQGTTTCIESSKSYSSTTTLTVDATLTVTRTYTHTVTPDSQPSSTSQPTKPYTIISARSGSLIHLLPLNAAGFRFHLGGSSASYCPTTVGEDCPPGNVTAFAGTCSMDVEVPGGQLIWATPDGVIGYTQAHSSFQPIGSIPCPFTYTKADSDQNGYISTSVFGATGLMACPDQSGSWQVFAALQNATVPNGNVSSCVGLNSLTSDYSSSTSSFSAWQYT